MNEDSKSVDINMLQKENNMKKNFLKKKEKYDPKTAIEKGKGSINLKNIEKKRIFKKEKDEESEEEVKVQN